MPDKDPPRKLRGTNHRLYRDKIVALEERIEEIAPKPAKIPKLQGKLEYGDIVAFPDGGSWQVFARRDWGIFMLKRPVRFLPSVQQCTFFTFEELEKKGAKKV